MEIQIGPLLKTDPNFPLLVQTGLAVGDVQQIQENAKLKKMAIQVQFNSSNLVHPNKQQLLSWWHQIFLHINVFRSSLLMSLFLCFEVDFALDVEVSLPEFLRRKFQCVKTKQAIHPNKMASNVYYKLGRFFNGPLSANSIAKVVFNEAVKRLSDFFEMMGTVLSSQKFQPARDCAVWLQQIFVWYQPRFICRKKTMMTTKTKLTARRLTSHTASLQSKSKATKTSWLNSIARWTSCKICFRKLMTEWLWTTLSMGHPERNRGETCAECEFPVSLPSRQEIPRHGVHQTFTNMYAQDCSPLLNGWPNINGRARFMPLSVR